MNSITILILSASTCMAGSPMLTTSQSMLQKILYPDKPRVIIEDITPSFYGHQPPAYAWAKQKADLYVMPNDSHDTAYFLESSVTYTPARLYFPPGSTDKNGNLIIPQKITDLQVYLEDKDGKKYKAKWEEVK